MIDDDHLIIDDDFNGDWWSTMIIQSLRVILMMIDDHPIIDDDFNYNVWKPIDYLRS